MDHTSYVYKFLLAPGYKIWRCASILLFFIVVSVNQLLVLSLEKAQLPQGNICWIAVCSVLIYVVTVYPLMKLVIKLLDSKKYMQFFACISFCALFYTVVTGVIYTVTVPGYNLLSLEALFDSLSDFAVYFLCVSGVTIPVFLKRWLVSNQHLNQLKIKQERSKIEELKEQIKPDAFFKTLHKSGTLIKNEPEKASGMLMKLGLLLRYQLYDCNRAQVLLTAEISFLRNYLELEQLHSSMFTYQLTTTGNLNGIFIPPSLLLPYVQSAVKPFEKQETAHTLHLRITREQDVVHSTITLEGITETSMLKEEYDRVKERFDLLYRGRYKFSFRQEEHVVALKLYPA